MTDFHPWRNVRVQLLGPSHTYELRRDDVRAGASALSLRTIRYARMNRLHIDD